VHKAKGALVPGPWLSGVVDLELDIWRNPAWLCRGEVGSYDFGVGVLVCEVAENEAISVFIGWKRKSDSSHGPNPRSCADVKDFLEQVSTLAMS
jgi:hypothetical protein